MKKREFILGVLGIVLLVVLAFFVANFIHENNTVDNNKSSDIKKNDNTIKVDGTVINFKTYRVDQMFFINVPVSFVMLDETSLKEKYNYNDRPELVFMSNDDLEHIYISTTNQNMTDEGLSDYLNNKISSLSNMSILDSGVYQKYNKSFAKLEVVDTTTYYNIRFFTLENKLVSVEFNAPVNDYKKWNKVVNEIMNSICFDESDIKKYSNS